MAWHTFDDGKKIGTKGSEDGLILIDLENSNGARITLEKDCGKIPFVITLGIYGLLVHTHFENSLESSNEYISRSKLTINKIFDLYNIQEARRDHSWQTEHEKLINSIVDL